MRFRSHGIGSRRDLVLGLPRTPLRPLDSAVRASGPRPETPNGDQRAHLRPSAAAGPTLGDGPTLILGKEGSTCENSEVTGSARAAI